MYSSEEVREAIIDARAFETGHAVFNSGKHSDVTIDMNRIESSIRSLRIVMGRVALELKTLGSDLVVPVPSGPNRLLEATKKTLPFEFPTVAGTKKLGIRDFYIHNPTLIKGANHITVFEDTITTGGALRSMAKKVRSFNPHAVMSLLGIWKRGTDEEVDYQDLFDEVIIIVNEPLPSWAAEDCVHPDCIA